MALSKHKRHLLNLYIISVIALVTGIIIILAGIFISLQLQKEIIELGRDLCVLEDGTQEDWGNIPGTRNRDLRHQFQIFLPSNKLDRSNYNNIKYGGEPVSQMFGSYTWQERREGQNITITEGTDYSNYTGQVFQFQHNVSFTQSGTPNKTLMNDTYTVYNYETFAKLYSNRLEEDWMKAIRALSTMINYTSVQTREQLILHKFKEDFFNSSYKSEEVFKSSKLYVFKPHPEVDASIYHEFWIDEAFGFKYFENVLYWGSICDNKLPYEYYFVHEYFTLSYSALNDFLYLFCGDWNKTANYVDEILSVGSDYSNEAKFYKQWAMSEGTLTIMEKESIIDIDPLVIGMPEMNVYFEQVFKSTDAIKQQYLSVNFGGITARQTEILKLFQDDDMRKSLFNATNMKMLYEYGAQVGFDDRGYYQTSLLDPLTVEMNYYTSNELYAIYRYLEYLVQNTFIREDNQTNTGDKISMALTLTDVLKNELQNFRITFSSKLLAALASKYTSMETCEFEAKRFFPSISSSITCRENSTWLNTTEGLEFWIKLYFGRDSKYETKDVTLKLYDKYFLDDTSEWFLFIRSLLDYFSVIGLDQACTYNQDSICTTQELAYNQLLTGYVTNFTIPMLKDKFNATPSFVEFFGLDNDTITPEFEFLGRFQDFVVNEVSEINYKSILQGTRNSRLFNPFYILNILNDECIDIRRYCQNEFLTWLTFMYRNYGFPSLFRNVTATEFFYGTDSDILTEIQQRNPKYGGDPTIRTQYNLLPYRGARNSTLDWRVFSGQNNPDKSRNILEYNKTLEYITVEKQFYHTDSDPSLSGIRNYTKNPWNHEVYTAYSTEGSQYIPNLHDNDDLMHFSPQIGAIKRVDYDGVTDIYGIKGYVYKTPISLYKRRDKQKIKLQTKGNMNPYHNYKYDNMFNISSLYGISYFATEPMYSIDSGEDVRYESTIINKNLEIMNDNTAYNDRIIVEPYSGILIRGDTSYQSNFLYDSWAPEGYKQYLMPYVLYQRRVDIDGNQADNLFENITVKDERMKIILVICIIVGGIIFAGGGATFMLAISGTIQRNHVLKKIQEEEEIRLELIRKNKKAKQKNLKKRKKVAKDINNTLE